MTKLKFTIIHVFVIAFLTVGSSLIVRISLSTCLFPGFETLFLLFGTINYFAGFFSLKNPTQKKEDVQKAYTFKLMTIRGSKFLLYLITALVYIQLIPDQVHFCFTLTFIMLFIVYTILEMIFYFNMLKSK